MRALGLDEERLLARTPEAHQLAVHAIVGEATADALFNEWTNQAAPVTVSINEISGPELGKYADFLEETLQGCERYRKKTSRMTEIVRLEPFRRNCFLKLLESCEVFDDSWVNQLRQRILVLIWGIRFLCALPGHIHGLSSLVADCNTLIRRYAEGCDITYRKMQEEEEATRKEEEIAKKHEGAYENDIQGKQETIFPASEEPGLNTPRKEIDITHHGRHFKSLVSCDKPVSITAVTPTPGHSKICSQGRPFATPAPRKGFMIDASPGPCLARRLPSRKDITPVKDLVDRPARTPCDSRSGRSSGRRPKGPGAGESRDVRGGAYPTSQGWSTGTDGFSVGKPMSGYESLYLRPSECKQNVLKNRPSPAAKYRPPNWSKPNLTPSLRAGCRPRAEWGLYRK
jgi:hypothetical protein